MLNIITPEKVFYEGAVEYLSLEAPDGRVGFMRGALPRVSVLKAGRLSIKAESVDESFMCGDGIVRVTKDGVTVLTSYCGQKRETDGSAADVDFKYVKAKIVSAVSSTTDKELS